MDTTPSGERGCSVVGSVFAESVAGYIKLDVGPLSSPATKVQGKALLGDGESQVSLRYPFSVAECCHCSVVNPLALLQP